MATRTPYRLQTDVTATDRAILQAVASLSDYAPMNPAYSLETVRQLEAELIRCQQAEDAIVRQATVAHEQTTAAAWALHEGVNGIKIQVTAQYGSDSPALYAVGRKRSSERKRPLRRQKAEA